MLKVYIQIDSGGKLKREHISAWIYSKLSKKYHDDGLEIYSNGSSVKAHSFYFTYNKELDKGDIECIEIRGLDVIENKLLSLLLNGEEVNLGRVKGFVYLVEKEVYQIKKLYKIKSPIIMRYKEIGSTPEEGYPVILPSTDKLRWESIVKNSIEVRAYKIWGDSLDSSIGHLNLVNEREVRAQLYLKGKNMVYGAVLGFIEIEADEFWHEFIQQVGLGNRNTYGYGIIG